jgi:hypothetical protein
MLGCTNIFPQKINRKKNRKKKKTENKNRK